MTICQLYSDTMSTYGDRGNVLYLKYFLSNYGLAPRTIYHRYGEPIPEAEIYIFGGGQDGSQLMTSEDLQGKNGQRLLHYLEQSYCLAVCGGYQLLGRAYVPQIGKEIRGLDYLPILTVAGQDRLVGPVVAARQFGKYERTIVGFENHSGQTYILDGSPVLGRVIKGAGNNGKDKGEGIIYQRTIGTYLHGPILPRNPHLTYWWLRELLRHIKPQRPNFQLEKQAHQAWLDAS